MQEFRAGLGAADPQGLVLDVLVVPGQLRSSPRWPGPSRSDYRAQPSWLAGLRIACRPGLWRTGCGPARPARTSSSRSPACGRSIGPGGRTRSESRSDRTRSLRPRKVPMGEQLSGREAHVPGPSIRSKPREVIADLPTRQDQIFMTTAAQVYRIEIERADPAQGRLTIDRDADQRSDNDADRRSASRWRGRKALVTGGSSASAARSRSPLRKPGQTWPFIFAGGRHGFGQPMLPTRRSRT